MDVAEAEEAARGTEDARRQTGPPDTAALTGGDAPKGVVPGGLQAVGDSSGSPGNDPLTQVLPAASSGGGTGEGVVPALQRAAVDSAASTETPGTATDSDPAAKVGDVKTSKEPPPEKSGVPMPTNAVAASKRPHPQASNDGSQPAAPGVEEPPAKTAQVRRSSLRPRPNVSSDKRGGNAEPGGQAPAIAPDGNAGDGTV
ncbi:U1 small nuclear ribonucleoprotein C-like [Rhipicephalus sanguineus]|uniref:U1 small nuclear ribonucleoprotein C-like n=1 Tax=Rhipicephalus sanguineus TaxID=34632 RepID=UPI0018943A18|nr:U1 small nuclear ribonucleoprotein C-like [Rhipicephalus sanguineus]